MDSANVYHHAAFYGIYTFFCFVTILYFLVRGMQTFRRYQSSGGVLIVLVALFLVGGVCIQMVDSQLNVTWLSVAVSSIMLYKFYSDLVQQVDGLTADFIGQIEAKREEDPRLPRVSIGYVLFDTREMNIQDAVTRADAEMYAAKQQDRTPAPEENQT